MKEKYLNYFDEIEKDSSIFNTVCKDEALKLMEENKNAFPMVVADNISTKGILTTANSKMLYNYTPPFDATAVERLKDAGGIILGKTSILEFGVGESKNPFGLEQAIQKDENILGVSSDSKGLLHTGAFEHGLFAFKPSYGLVSRYGLIAIASSIDTIGLVSKDFDKLPKALNIIAGDDGRDSTLVDEKFDFSTLEEINLESIKTLEIKDKNDIADLNLDLAMPVYEIISSGEFASNMEKFDGISFGYRTENYEDVEQLYKNTRSESLGKEVQEKIIFGNYSLSSGQYEDYYVQAMKGRTAIKETLDKVLDENEFIISPVNMGFVAAYNLSGLPVISIPYGDEGVLITTKAFNDKRLLSFAKEFITKRLGE